MAIDYKKETTNELLDIILECKSVLTSINDNCISSKEIEQEVFDFSELLSAKMKAYAET